MKKKNECYIRETDQGVLRGIAWSECLVYLDDILVFGPDFETTLARLESMLDRLGAAGLKLKAKKCQLFQEESVPGPYSISCGDWRRPGQMPPGTGLAGPQRPTRGMVVRRTMFIVQKTYSGLHRASRPLV